MFMEAIKYVLFVIPSDRTFAPDEMLAADQAAITSNILKLQIQSGIHSARGLRADSPLKNMDEELATELLESISIR